jgi:hypothetical protein
MGTTLTVSVTTKNRLLRLGHKGETYDQLICALLNKYDKTEGASK